MWNERWEFSKDARSSFWTIAIFLKKKKKLWAFELTAHYQILDKDCFFKKAHVNCIIIFFYHILFLLSASAVSSDILQSPDLSLLLNGDNPIGLVTQEL